MPHCCLWHDSDWEFALDAALVADEFYRTGKTAWASELRHWERVMAVTMDDRRSQRIVYVEPRPQVDVAQHHVGRELVPLATVRTLQV